MPCNPLSTQFVNFPKFPGLWSTYNLNVPEKYMKTVSTPSIPAGTCHLFSHAAEIKREDKEMVGCKMRCSQTLQSNLSLDVGGL